MATIIWASIAIIAVIVIGIIAIKHFLFPTKLKERTTFTLDQAEANAIQKEKIAKAVLATAVQQHEATIKTEQILIRNKEMLPESIKIQELKNNLAEAELETDRIKKARGKVNESLGMKSVKFCIIPAFLILIAFGLMIVFTLFENRAETMKLEKKAIVESVSERKVKPRIISEEQTVNDNSRSQESLSELSDIISEQ